MCGIFAVLNNKNLDKNMLEQEFMKGKSRGPEYSKFQNISQNISLGFHRLAINGVEDDFSNQPFFIDGIYLICNGEIYNYKELTKILNITPKSKSDCEVIIHLYKKYGIKQTVQMLDGVFAFVLVDTNKQNIFVARDTYGVRPLFISIFKKEISISNNEMKYYTSFAFASEMKSLINIGKDVFDEKICQFVPGCVSTFKYDDENYIEHVEETSFSSPNSFSTLNNNIKKDVLENIYKKIYQAVEKRVDNTERPIACLLSGGLDSSLIAALVKQIHKGELHTWSIGFEGSEDLKCARIVADHIGSIHHSIQVSEEEFLLAIPEVIHNIESYDTTTVRASVGNWLISKKIKEFSNAKVIFNGDGADEVMGGYLYFHEAPDSISFDKECRKLLTDIHYFDVLRSDRSISSHGLEARTPFLDREFVQYYLSISYKLRDHSYNKSAEKYLIREAIEKHNPTLLPEEVLFRTKEAFSDGVSKQTKSWYEIIQDFVKEEVFSHLGYDEEYIIKNMNPYIYNRPKTLEQLYYRDIFSNLFPKIGVEKIIPYFWMPNFVKNATDASARTLGVYTQKKSCV
uniref:asparagine synthase (glutamine-hydrolyzing) n=1 Tax=viral metagenome TaxID=1070528 RepID=A0A6C0JFD1_9ZZZZ|tara:strand:- start:6 stop:1718 length:1713 start_codon:yes stop_codon:yes gene_type:complete